MIGSEIVAKVKKKKVHPSQPSKVFVIGNLIPFKNLNMVFAFGIIVRAIIDIVWTTKYGLPKIAIQTTVMLFCLLLCNADAKTHFKRRFAAWRGVDIGAKNTKGTPEPTEDIQMDSVEIQDEEHQENNHTSDIEPTVADQIYVVPIMEHNL